MINTVNLLVKIMPHFDFSKMKPNLLVLIYLKEKPFQTKRLKMEFSGILKQL